MNNYAVIVGLDYYENPDWVLKAAVADARRFAAWAIEFGGVRAENIRLLLSSRDNPSHITLSRPPITLPVINATSESLNTLLYDEFQDKHWAEDGDRLYFYYAGHGCSHPGVRKEGQPEPVLIFPDVERLPRDFKRLVPFTEIILPLRGCGPNEQFFFLDACQDFALEGKVESGGLGGGRYIRPLTLTTGATARKQFVLYATSPGERAIETRGKGVFGEALLRGLRGDPAAAQRIAGAGSYELRLENLLHFVQKEVQRKVSNIPNATRYIQIPERDSEPSVPDPLILSFKEADIQEVDLIVRVAPGSALGNAALTVYYETFPKAGPYGPPLDPAKLLRLKPAYYSIEVGAPPSYGWTRSDPFRVPAEQPLEIVLSPALGPSAPAAPGSTFLQFHLNDNYSMIAVVGPVGFRTVGSGSVFLHQPLPGVYKVRIVTPEGMVDEQVFEYPFSSGLIQLKPPAHHIGPEQLSMLQQAGITPSPEGYLKPSEQLGELSGVAPASLLGFAAYAAYTLNPKVDNALRSFDLQPVADDGKDKAWLSVLLSVEADREAIDTFLEHASVVIYAKTYRMSRLTRLPGFPAAAQYLDTVNEGNITVELRLPNLSPIRLPITCLRGRVATICMNVTLAGQLEMQVYLVPFGEVHMFPETLRTIEQAQRFYASSEPMPPAITNLLLHMKQTDPLLGCLAGYTLIKEGRNSEFRGAPDPCLVPGEWNENSPMQNMLLNYGLLPDSHVLAALCEPEQREQHFSAALKLGPPLFSEGFRALMDFYKERERELSWPLRHARRMLVTGAAYTTWFGYEPAVTIENGTFNTPPPPWSTLTEIRSRIEREAAAVGAVHVEENGEVTFRTGFLVTPDLVVTVNHVIQPILQPSESPNGQPLSIRQGVRTSFITSDRISAASTAQEVESVVVIDAVSRLALLRLRRPIREIEPLRIISAGDKAKVGSTIYLIGYPFLQNDIDPNLVAHVFGSNLGTKRIQPGYIISTQSSRPSFDHDAFTMGGSGGSPIIGIDSGVVVGVHWGGMTQLNARRGRAVALWKAPNRELLKAAHVLTE